MNTYRNHFLSVELELNYLKGEKDEHRDRINIQSVFSKIGRDQCSKSDRGLDLDIHSLHPDCFYFSRIINLTKEDQQQYAEVPTSIMISNITKQP